METIDVHDLPEEEARLVAAFVEFLRQKHRTTAFLKEETAKEQEWSAMARSSFAQDGDNGHDAIYAIYDHWREQYPVADR